MLNEKTLYEYVYTREGEEVKEFLTEIWEVMKKTIEMGLSKKGMLYGGLDIRKRAKELHESIGQIH